MGKGREVAVAAKAKSKGGRPTSYTQELGDEICGLLAQGISLKRICEQKGMPERKSIYNWLRTHDEFLHNYTRAKEDSADALAEDIQDIGNRTLAAEYDPQAARVAIDAYKWTASKLKPKKYGDRQFIEGEQSITHHFKDMPDDQLDAAIQAAKDSIS